MLRKLRLRFRPNDFLIKKSVYSAGIVDWTMEERTNIEGPKGSWR